MDEETRELIKKLTNRISELESKVSGLENKIESLQDELKTHETIFSHSFSNYY